MCCCSAPIDADVPTYEVSPEMGLTRLVGRVGERGREEVPSDTSQKNGETFMSSVAASGDRRFMGDDFSALGFDFPDVDGLGKLRYDEERYGMR